MCKCPAHSDRTASLSIRETDDHRILLNCFGGCSANDIVQAVGLSLADLFPRDPAPEWRSPSRVPQFDSAGFLDACRNLLVGLCCLVADVAAGRDVPDSDLQWAASEASRLLGLLDIGEASR